MGKRREEKRREEKEEGVRKKVNDARKRKEGKER